MGRPRRVRKIEFEVMLVRSGLTIAELSKLSGIPIRTIHDVRRRQYAEPPLASTVAGLARALRVTQRKLREVIGAPANGRKAAQKRSSQAVAATR